MMKSIKQPFLYFQNISFLFFVGFIFLLHLNVASAKLTKPVLGVRTINPQEIVDAIKKNSPFYKELTFNLEKEQGQLLAQKGNFDTKLKSKYDSIEKDKDFDNSQVSLEQPLGPAGANLFGTYRKTDGSLPSYWDKDSTNAGGELAMGVSVRPLQGLLIDKRRASLQKQELSLEAFGFQFTQSSLQLVQEGLEHYYSWALAYQQLEAFQQLLDVALDRDKWLRVRVRKGDRAKIEIDENQRVILNRQAGIAKQKTKMQLAFRKLNLFLGDYFPVGKVNYKPVRLLEDHFSFPMKLDSLNQWVKTAQNQRQDLKALSLKIKEKQVEQKLQRQSRLPDLSVSGEWAQDRGSSRGQFDGNEVRIQGTLSFPLWMRKARGKTRVAEAEVKIAKLKEQYGKQKIRTQLKNSWDTLALLRRQLTLKRREVELSEKLEKAEHKRFRYGGSSLININIRETDFIKSKINYIEVRAQSHIETIRFYVTAGQLPPTL